MSEYISREAAIKKMQNYKAACEDIENFKEARIAERTIVFLEEIPAADVREIKRGRWSFDNIIFTDADGTSRSGMRGYKCSECDGFCIVESNFCPNCGARMEEQT